MTMHTGNEGITAFDAVHEGLLAKEIERPIDRDRRRPGATQGQTIDQLIGAERLMARQQRLQDPTADRSQALFSSGADRFGVPDSVAHAAFMVVVRPGEYRVRL